MSREPLRLVIIPTQTERSSFADYSGSTLFAQERQEAFIKFLYLLDSVKLESPTGRPYVARDRDVDA